MKLMIASDLHGSAAYTRRLLELYRDTGCQRLVPLFYASLSCHSDFL